MKVVVDFLDPPIGSDHLDYVCYDADSYDGADDAQGQIVGYGRTQAEAIIDFQRQWDEAKGS